MIWKPKYSPAQQVERICSTFFLLSSKNPMYTAALCLLRQRTCVYAARYLLSDNKQFNLEFRQMRLVIPERKELRYLMK